VVPCDLLRIFFCRPIPTSDSGLDRWSNARAVAMFVE
jgi:hypothetical protein